MLFASGSELEYSWLAALRQAAVPVLPDDTPETLAARVLAQEHRIYPQAVRWFVDDRLELAGGRVSLRDAPAQDGAALLVPAPDMGRRP